MNDISNNPIPEQSEKITELVMSGASPSELETAILESRDIIDRSKIPGHTMTRAEMNELLEAEGLDIRVRTEPKTVDPTVEVINEIQEFDSRSDEFLAQQEKQAQIYAGLNPTTHGMFKSYFKQETVTNPNKDRSLSGKARRKARRGN